MRLIRADSIQTYSPATMPAHAASEMLAARLYANWQATGHEGPIELPWVNCPVMAAIIADDADKLVMLRQAAQAFDAYGIAHLVSQMNEREASRPLAWTLTVTICIQPEDTVTGDVNGIKRERLPFTVNRDGWQQIVRPTGLL